MLGTWHACRFSLQWQRVWRDSPTVSSKGVAFNPFVGLTEAELLAARRSIQTEMLSGSQLQSSSAGDVQASSIIQMGPFQRFALIQRALFAINPDLYPLSQIPPTRSVAVMGASV